MFKQIITYRQQYDLYCYFIQFWRIKSRARQYYREKNIFFSFACKQVTGNFIAPKIHTWKHLEIFNVDYVVVCVYLAIGRI